MLVERAQSLAVLTEELAAARAGRGRLVFLGGEAGVGKTTLLSAFTAALPEDVPVRRGGCDNVTTAPALGPLLEALPRLADVLAQVDQLDSLRLLGVVREELAARPGVLILEDVHWADKATFEVLGMLARRLDTVRTLAVATFRADEVPVDHPLTTLLGDVATQPGVVRMQLPPLTLEGVRQLLGASGTAVDAEVLYRRTGGNPFFVTEVLAGSEDEVPASVRDAVLARASRLSPAARRVLNAAAVLGLPSELSLLCAVAGEDGASVDECVRRGVLIEQEGRVAFRHELGRMTIEQSLPPGDRAELHAGALAALSTRNPPDDRRLAYHAVGCDNRTAVLRHAVPAALRSARLRAHREAAELYRTALDHGDPPPNTRAELCAALSYECYLTDQLPAAYDARLEAMRLAEEAGDQQAVGVAQRWLSRLSWFLGRRAESSAWADRAIGTLEPLGESAELAMAYSNLTQLHMLAHDPAAALAVGERALGLARRVGAREAEIHVLNNIGTALVIGGQVDAGVMRLEESLQLALAADAQEHAARAYTNLGASAVLERRFGPAERTLRAGIDYCADRDLGSWRLYMSGWLARLHAERGRYGEAERVAHDVLRHRQLSPITRIGARTVLAQVAARQGRPDERGLDEERELAAATQESQRLVPVACAAAERAWLRGDLDGIPEEVELAWPAVVEHPTPWELGELAWWLAAAGIRRELPGPVAPPFALMLAGDWRRATAAWEAMGCPLWAAICLARSPELEDGRRALAIADDLGAPAVREALIRDRHATGAPVPRGPRATSRSNAWGLTAREVEVLTLLGDGLSNADLAARLFLSEKTVGHHVSSILRKMGEPTRSRAVATARARGIGAAN